MEYKRFVQYTEKLFTALFCGFIFVFYALFYNNHLHFVEQNQLFLLTGDYFISEIGFPGGFSGYIGGFLTQFYFVSLAGPLIITLLLFGIQLTTRHILLAANGNDSLFPLSFFPALFAGMLLCDEFYPLSAIVGFLIALLFGFIYLSMKKSRYRFVAGALFIPFVYWLTGGAYIMLLSVILVFEIFVRRRFKKMPGNTKKSEIADPGKLSVWHFSVYIAEAALIPLLVKGFLILQPLMLSYISEFYYDLHTVLPASILVLFALPASLLIVISFLPVKIKAYNAAIWTQMTTIFIAGYFGFRLLSNFAAEEIFTYDYLVRNQRWTDIISIAEKKPPRNNLSLAMLNLSLAKTGKMGDDMFNFEQNGIEGLFLPEADEYFASMIRSDIFFQLRLINASQECAFERMETNPSLNKPVRSIVRLTETNLLNGQYEVAMKYIKLLKNTTFYHDWAIDTERFLYNEDLINNHPVWGEQRKLMIKEDFFFKVQNRESTLNMLNILINENQQNRIAFEYLMSSYLINKDILNIMNCISIIDKLDYRPVPDLYQEVILLVSGLTSQNQTTDIHLKVSDYTKERMKRYTNIYMSTNKPQEFLKKGFSGTYWYYFHFKPIDINSGK
jgi:hypothetical protein